MAFLARGSNHLLEGQRFEAVLTVGEKHLSKALQEFVRQLDAPEVRNSVRETAAWPEVKRMLINLGCTPTETY